MHPAPRRMVWLPGAYHQAADFLAAGFAHAVHERQLPIDLDFIDLDMKHLQDRDAMDDLRREVLLPARRTGQVWLCGISLGGLLALSHARQYAHEVDGLLLLAPYLGNRLVIGELERAGGPHRWQPGTLDQEDEERRVWRYVQQRSTADTPIYLGYGLQDRFAGSHRLLAELLPPACVDTMSGGHDWPTWVELWGNFLNQQCR